MGDELADLQREWRKEITEALKELRDQNANVLKELHSMRKEFAEAVKVRELETRIQVIEDQRSKLVGALIVVQAIGAIGLAILTKIWK